MRRRRCPPAPPHERRRHGRSRDQRGSVVPLVVTFVGVLLTVGLLVAALGGVVADQRRVESAVDLAALAGASAVQHGRSGCDQAARLLRRNGAVPLRCAVQGQIVVVAASRRTHPILGRTWTVRSTARAGPEGNLG